MDILFKLWVEATEKMTQNTENSLDNSQSKNQRERKIASKWHVCSSYFVFPPYYILHLKTETEGADALNLRLLLFVRYGENVALKIC